MRKYIAYSVIFITIITLTTWLYYNYARMSLPEVVTTYIISFTTIFSFVLVMLSNFKDVVDLFKGLDKRSVISPSEKARSRKVLLKRVEQYWIEGVLEQSLYGATLLEIDKEYSPHSVSYPWAFVNQEKASIPPEKNIRDIFDESGGELLILGEPGSGKTTLLLTLASELISRAERDESQTIPVVLNLSTWANKQRPFKEWLVDELHSKYFIPKYIGEDWLSKNEISILLDGLDEVKCDAREACIKSLNTFRKEKGLIFIVVCCRKLEYELLENRLCLQKAVSLLPLTSELIDQYLSGVGNDLSAVRQLLKKDNELNELAKSPLMLGIMTLAFRGNPVSNLGPFKTIDDRRNFIFKSYIEKMMDRRKTHCQYDLSEVNKYLSWVAKNMRQHSLSVFMVEDIQSGWIKTTSCRFA